jgi:nicotinate-nucleotide pyrophosphorylase (carboxylating)
MAKSDVTTLCAVDKGLRIKAVIVARAPGVICGIGIAKEVFRTFDRRIKFSALRTDGAMLKKNTTVAVIAGGASSILSAERVAINFLSLLSGIATRTRLFVERVRPYRVQIMDTRKTLPGLRALEKYAVRVGGGHNHRMSLDAMALIKENHLDAAGVANPTNIVAKIRRKTRGRCIIEVEARSLDECAQALGSKPDIVLLDNMSVRQVRSCVQLRNKFSRRDSHRVLLEASGNIRFRTIKRYAACGIERISLGTLTKDIEALDFSLDIT